MINNLNCPSCGQKLKIQPNSWVCSWICSNCGLQINKKISGKTITPEIISQLCKDKRTAIMSGFISKNQKPFSAALVVQGNRIVFEFPDHINSNSTENNKQVVIRVESPSSGVAGIYITGPVNFQCTANFGLIPTRLAECMGVISAGRYLLYNQYNKRLVIKANNRDFVEYALREVIPARKEARYLIEYMWQVLGRFEAWEIKYEHQKRSSLRGGVVQSTFPRGLFPWLKVDIFPEGKNIRVQLPDDPSLIANFRASIRTAQGEGCIYTVPSGAEKVVRAWAATVKGQQ
ncbi:topoisomerase C-terminal repeat-containing protein [Syntrophomonas palmitatica]|uniref:topoisomerase C-terminal repeat-containing protein n=1 Tax=Syntrophomonas palmitatica TaxID=402877 RepID=UPI0006CF8267|nr:topoisomerase C-terminal repeat-containing protein [Syntrophomonas palmitatica]